MNVPEAEEVDVAIVGGGQAGLATSYHLTDQSIPHVVLERGRIGESWRSQRWGSFRINTTNKVNVLPGSPYTGGDPEAFMTAEQWADSLASYASENSLPVRSGVAVGSVVTDGERFIVGTSDGNLSTRSVVAATGSFIVAKIPALAQDLPPDIIQLDAGMYRTAGDLPDGTTLVVGSGDSGCQIAEDLIESARDVYVCLANRRRVPRRYRGLDLCDWSVLSGRWDMTVDAVEDPNVIWNPDAPLASGVGGGHTLSYQALRAKGATLLGKLIGVEGSTLMFDDRVNDYVKFGDDASADAKKGMDALVERLGMDVPRPEIDPLDLPDTRAESRPVIPTLDCRDAGITSVIWTIGFTHDFSWLDMPVFDDQGHPVHERGVTQVPGLYFIGLHWLHTLSSGLISGVGRDAEYLAGAIARHLT